MKLLKMKTPPVKASVIAFLSCAFCLLASDAVAEPKTIYVDQKVETSGDGLSWETAVKTIQEGVNKASKTEVDTILVAPGEYADEPGVSEPTSAGRYLYHRIKLDRKVILKSSEGKEVTHIVGCPGDGQGFNDPDTGLPPVMCVYIPSTGRGSIVEGFTIRDGEVPVVFATSVRSAGVGDPGMTGNNSYDLEDHPEAFWYVAYCTISNCCAGRGAAVSGGTIIGSLIADNHTYTNGSTIATTYVHAYNCIFTRNGAKSKGGGDVWKAVNCTVVYNGFDKGFAYERGISASGAGAEFYNTAIFGNAKARFANNIPVCKDCLLDGSDGVAEESERIIEIPTVSSAPLTNLVMSAVLGDMRPIKGSLLDGKGNREHLALDFIPEQYRNRDFFGNELEEGAPIPIGVILPTVVPASAGVLLSTYDFKLDGHQIDCANFVHYTDSWPTVARFSAADGKENLFVGVSVNPYAEEVGYRKFCGKYDFAPLTLPPYRDADGNVLPPLGVSKLMANADNFLWVDDDAEFEGDPDGSVDKPYRTIQDAVDVATAAKKFYVINVREGTYNSGSTVDSTELKARVRITSAADLLIRGVDGAEKTFVEGEPDPNPVDPENDPGIGPDACRIFWMHSDSNVALVNLTLRKGYGGWLAKSGSGSAIVCGSNKQQAYDCVFTDNHIVRERTTEPKAQLQGSCCLNGWFIRCVFKDNLNYNRGIISKSTLTACQIAHNARGGSDNATAERYCWQEGNVYQTTVYEPATKNNSYTFHTSGRADGCVIVGGDLSASDPAADMWVNNIGYDFVNSRAHPDAIIYTDPWLAAVGRDDFHPVEGSPVIGYAEFSKSTTRLGARLRNICTDFENKPVFTADGKVTIGAFATLHEKSDVYVDATNGSDENDGKSADAAKKTLEKAVEALCRKDRIVALPGVYKEGSMIHSVISSEVKKTLTVRARVVVPDATELVAQGSANETIIEGEPDPNPTGTDTYGLGPNAMRGVVLGKGSVLRGFTVTKGRTAIYDKDVTGYSDNVQGAGVLGRSPADSRVVDCILTGNYGDCGGAGAYVTFERCKIVGNRTTRFGSGFRSASAVNCYFDDNWGDRVCEGVVQVLGCTFGPSNMNPSGAKGTMMLCQAGNDVQPLVQNVLSLSIATSANDIKSATVRNCVFPQGASFTSCTTVEDVNTDLTRDELLALYDENGVPKNVRAPSVDLGGENSLQGETDLAGNPRVLNGAIDIGCYEADWKGQYAKDLGGRRATVTEATANVRDVDGEIVLADGAGLALELAANGYTVKIEFTVKDGTLAVMRGGEVFGTYTAGQILSLNDTADLENFAFTYEGTGNATLACCKAMPGMFLLMR